MATEFIIALLKIINNAEIILTSLLLASFQIKDYETIKLLQDLAIECKENSISKQ